MVGHLITTSTGIFAAIDVNLYGKTIVARQNVESDTPRKSREALDEKINMQDIWTQVGRNES